MLDAILPLMCTMAHGAPNHRWMAASEDSYIVIRAQYDMTNSVHMIMYIHEYVLCTPRHKLSVPHLQCSLPAQG
jgi:hypothetical protein